MTVENVPSEANPKTGKLTALSVLACLRGLAATLKVGQLGRHYGIMLASFPGGMAG